MSKPVTWVCWGLVVALWIVEAALGGRRLAGHCGRTRPGEVLWQLGVVVLVS